MFCVCVCCTRTIELFDPLVPIIKSKLTNNQAAVCTRPGVPFQLHLMGATFSLISLGRFNYGKSLPPFLHMLGLGEEVFRFVINF